MFLHFLFTDITLTCKKFKYSEKNRKSFEFILPCKEIVFMT